MVRVRCLVPNQEPLPKDDPESIWADMPPEMTDAMSEGEDMGDGGDREVMVDGASEGNRSSSPDVQYASNAAPRTPDSKSCSEWLGKSEVGSGNDETSEAESNISSSVSKTSRQLTSTGLLQSVMGLHIKHENPPSDPTPNLTSDPTPNLTSNLASNPTSNPASDPDSDSLASPKPLLKYFLKILKDERSAELRRIGEKRKWEKDELREEKQDREDERKLTETDKKRASMRDRKAKSRALRKEKEIKEGTRQPDGKKRKVVRHTYFGV